MSVEYKYVASSNIRGVGYDKVSSTMYIEFTSGARYSYAGVPEEEYTSLVNAPSVGTYFHDNIRSTYDGVRT